MANTPTPRPGRQRIAAERQRQIQEKGFTPEHDLLHHTPQELMNAAWCYLLQAEARSEGFSVFTDRAPATWPFHPDSWKPSPSPVRNLEKTGALIAAAIDLQIAQGFCPEREDSTHCNCWWDEFGPCCNCGDDTDNPNPYDHHQGKESR